MYFGGLCRHNPLKKRKNAQHTSLLAKLLNIYHLPLPLHRHPKNTHTPLSPLSKTSLLLSFFFFFFFFMLPLPRQSLVAWLASIIVCFQPLPPLANLTTDWYGMPRHPSTTTTTPHCPHYAHTYAQYRVAIRSLNGLCFLGRHRADSKANSHCLKWHCCPGICLTFCLMHKAESMQNPCLINIFPLFPLSHSFRCFPFIPVQPEKKEKKKPSFFSPCSSCYIYIRYYGSINSSVLGELLRIHNITNHTMFITIGIPTFILAFIVTSGVFLCGGKCVHSVQKTIAGIRH